MYNLSYLRKIRSDSPPSPQKVNLGFKGLKTSISTSSLRKLLKVSFSLVLSSTLMRFPRPFPMEMEICVVMLIRGRP